MKDITHVKEPDLDVINSSEQLKQVSEIFIGDCHCVVEVYSMAVPQMRSPILRSTLGLDYLDGRKRDPIDRGPSRSCAYDGTAFRSDPYGVASQPPAHRTASNVPIVVDQIWFA